MTKGMPESRSAVSVLEDKMDLMRAISYWNECLIKNSVDKAIDDYIEKHKSILDKAIIEYRKHKFHMGK